MDPNSSYAHALLCRIRATYDWDFPAAENECRRAVELDPQNQDARRELAFLLNSLGREYEALKEMDVAIALAPTSFNKQSRGLLLYFDRRFDEAINQLKQVEATDPESSESSRWIARCLQTKQYGRALEFFIKFRESGGAAPEEISIASLGSQYVLGLRARNCNTGSILDQEQIQAARREDVLNSLSQIASKFRTRVGESLATVEKHSMPLAGATTHHWKP